MTDQLERNLSDALHGIADHAPAGGGWDAIHGRIARRERARGRRRAAVAAVMVVALAGGLASTVGRAGRRQVVAGPPAAPAALPRLVLDLDGYTLVGATELADAPLEAARGGSLTVLARPGSGLSGPALFVRTVPDGAQYGFGEQSPIARTVDIAGRTGYVQPYTSLARSLGWRLEDGSGVHLVSLRLDEEQLLAAARALRIDAGVVTWAPDALPAGLVPLRTTESEPTSTVFAETAYRGPNGESVKVLAQPGGQHVVDDYVLDRAAAARQVSEVEVDGVAAVISTYELGDRRSLIWPVRPGFMAEMDGTDLTDAELVAAAESLRVADDEEWTRLLATVGPEEPGQSPANTEAIGTLGATRCLLRDKWLSADGAGDRASRDAALRELSALIDRYRAEGVQPNGDIFVVVDRLVAAMQSGDVAAVQAQRCN
jgi:hypothetical protein